MRLRASEVLRFGVVGVTQNLANLLSFAALDAADVWYLAAAIVAGGIGLLVGFVLNRAWTFRSDDPAVLRQAVRYATVHVAAVGAGALVLVALVEGTKLDPVAGQALAIVLVAPSSFLVQRAWTFRLGPRAADDELALRPEVDLPGPPAGVGAEHHRASLPSLDSAELGDRRHVAEARDPDLDAARRVADDEA